VNFLLREAMATPLRGLRPPFSLGENGHRARCLEGGEAGSFAEKKAEPRKGPTGQFGKTAFRSADLEMGFRVAAGMGARTLELGVAEPPSLLTGPGDVRQGRLETTLCQAGRSR